jgi:hypothetical protein
MGGGASGDAKGGARPTASAPSSSIPEATATAATAGATAEATAAADAPRPRTELALLDSISGTRGGHTVAYHRAVLCPPSDADCTSTVPPEGTGYLYPVDDPEVKKLQLRPLAEGFSAWYWLEPSDKRMAITPAGLAGADDHGGLGWDDDLTQRPFVRVTIDESGSISAVEGIDLHLS